MFECILVVYLPISTGANEGSFFRVAQYNFEPNLQVGDQVSLENVNFTISQDNVSGERKPNTKNFNFCASVMKKNKVILTEKRNNQVVDIFRVVINLEIKDKEMMPQIVKYMLDTFPNDYTKLEESE